MKNHFYATLLALTAFCVSMSARATVPDVIPVQGVLSDSSGVVLEGAYDITFSIYDASDAASPIWTDTFTAVDLDAGFFTVYLGSGTALGFIDYLSYDNLWLGIQVTGDDEMERVPFAAVPFAIEAEVCQRVGDLTEADINANFLSSSYSPSWGELTGVPAEIADGDAVGYSTETELTTLLDDNYAAVAHTHSGVYANASHDHDANYAAVAHSHDADYSPLGHTHDADYAAIGHSHSDLQARVSSTCAAGSAIRVIAADGTVTCEADNNTTYSAGTGLDISGTTFSVDPTDFMEPIQYVYDGSSIAVANGATITVISDSISAPVAGTVLVFTEADIWADNLSASNTSAQIDCAISTSSSGTATGAGSAYSSVYYSGNTYNTRHLFHMMQFAVNAGTTTFYWRGRVAAGDEIRFIRSKMTSVFIPN